MGQWRTAQQIGLLAAVLASMAIGEAAQGIVLCFGDDGHVEIEAAGPGGCLDAHGASTPVLAARAQPVASWHCGPCVDVALAGSGATDALTGARRPATPSASMPAMAGGADRSIGRRSTAHLPVAFFRWEKPYPVVLRC